MGRTATRTVPSLPTSAGMVPAAITRPSSTTTTWSARASASFIWWVVSTIAVPSSRRDLIRSLRDEGTAIVLTTHQMNEAEALADQVVVVDEGRVIAAGTIPALVGSDGTVRVAVRPIDGAAAPPATDYVLAARLAAALEGAVQVAAVSPGVLQVRAAADPALLHAITGWAAGQGILVDVAPGRRTLEDVFLDLTGRHLR